MKFTRQDFRDKNLDEVLFNKLLRYDYNYLNYLEPKYKTIVDKNGYTRSLRILDTELLRKAIEKNLDKLYRINRTGTVAVRINLFNKALKDLALVKEKLKEKK